MLLIKLLFLCSIPCFFISKGDRQKAGKDRFFVKAVVISCIPDVGIFWWGLALICGSVCNSSTGIFCRSFYTLGGSRKRGRTDSIMALQEDRAVERRNINLDGFCFLYY